MSPGRRDLAWFAAGFLSAVAIALFAWLMRPNAPGGAITAATAAGGGVAGGGADVAGAGANAGSATDATGTAPDITPHAAAPGGGAPANAGSMGEMLARLESRLATQGGTDADWELLAQTYDFMGRAADATSARAHQVPGASASASPRTTAAGAAAATAAGSAQLDGVVDIATALKSKAPAGLTLFVVAKAVGAPGPPVGVMRTSTSQWPLPFRLDDSSAMVPGRNLSSAAAVTLQARVSHSGMASPQPGDLQSDAITVNPRDHKSLQLLINQEIR
jgi:hypothetical protein